MHKILIRDNETNEVVHVIEVHGGEKNVSRVLDGLAQQINWEKFHIDQEEE